MLVQTTFQFIRFETLFYPLGSTSHSLCCNCSHPPFQTLNSISAEKNSTIIFPLPIDFITHFMKDGNAPKGEKED